jgi:carbamoyltransferase
MIERAPFVIENDDAPRLQEVLRKLAAIGYWEKAVAERLGLENISDLNWRALPMYHAERLANRDALDLAIDLFLLQGQLTAAELNRLLPLTERHTLTQCELLSTDAQGVTRARASLFPVGERLIFSDHAWPELPHPGYTTVPGDHVMGIGLDSRNLAHCTVRRPLRNVLDLCTGSGIHGVLAATHSGHVLAIDVNPRAALCTRFNARASAAANLDVAVGDLYDAAPGESFDLITANPPFVPSPLNSLRFRDGGRSGEDVLKRIVAGLPHHLAAGGMAQIVTELGEREGESLVERLRDWLGGAAMDIYLLRLGEHTAMKYAMGHAKGDSYQEFLNSIHLWAGNLRAQGYVRVVTAVISFQWSDPQCGLPWERIDESPPPRRSAGAEIEAAFLAERVARRQDWHEILDHRWLRRAGPIAALDARVLGNAIEAKTKATLLGKALKVEHRLEPLERAILDKVDRAFPARELISALREFGVGETAAITSIRSLLRSGLLCETKPQYDCNLRPLRAS